MYHPFTEAIASMLCDMPYKVLNAIFFNVTLYFMSNLRREPGAFFVFLLFSFVTTLTMSMLFRTIAAASRSLSQALVPAAILILGLVIYTGFTIPTRSMLGWSRWMNYINPIGYGFESLMVNEFNNRQFTCPQTNMVPLGDTYSDMRYKVCTTVGAVAGSDIVQGTDYLHGSFQYYESHKWRNLGIMFGFMVFFMATYLFGTEFISEQKSKGEVLLFRRGGGSRHQPDDVENGAHEVSGTEYNGKEATAGIQRQEAVFHWQDVCYDIKTKDGSRRILDHVDGWVKPGTCTALMVSISIVLNCGVSFLTSFRVSLVLVKRRYWTSLLLV